MNVAMIGTLTTYVILLHLRYIPSILGNGVKNDFFQNDVQHSSSAFKIG
jgi:hypothetical protein